MKKLLLVSLVVVFIAGCGAPKEPVVLQKEANVAKSVVAVKEADVALLIAGQGGTSGHMFMKAAETYKREKGGVIYRVSSGDEFVAAVKDFVEKNGRIEHLEYFGHGNHVGLYVNQEPGINGGLYANDPDLDAGYLAGSIYELPHDIFVKNGWIRFNGCNVAGGLVPSASLAQNIANYFDVDVQAPRGPTEFSKNPNTVDPIENSKYLGKNFSGNVYMVATYEKKPFVVVKPGVLSASGFADVRVGQEYEEAVAGLVAANTARHSALAAVAGAKFDFLKVGLDGEEKRFLPYKNVTYGEAVGFCKLAVSEMAKCKLAGFKDGDLIRNLKALKMLLDAGGVKLKSGKTWYGPYISWANGWDLLTRDFVTKKWYTRGEMAQLTWNFMVARKAGKF